MLFGHYFLSFSVIKHESEKVHLFELLYYTFKEEKLQPRDRAASHLGNSMVQKEEGTLHDGPDRRCNLHALCHRYREATSGIADHAHITGSSRACSEHIHKCETGTLGHSRRTLPRRIRRDRKTHCIQNSSPQKNAERNRSVARHRSRRLRGDVHIGQSVYKFIGVEFL